LEKKSGPVVEGREGEKVEAMTKEKIE